LLGFAAQEVQLPIVDPENVEYSFFVKVIAELQTELQKITAAEILYDFFLEHPLYPVNELQPVNPV